LDEFALQLRKVSKDRRGCPSVHLGVGDAALDSDKNRPIQVRDR
jgi:hypothetical protein